MAPAVSLREIITSHVGAHKILHLYYNMSPYDIIHLLDAGTGLINGNREPQSTRSGFEDN